MDWILSALLAQRLAGLEKDGKAADKGTRTTTATTTTIFVPEIYGDGEQVGEVGHAVEIRGEDADNGEKGEEEEYDDYDDCRNSGSCSPEIYTPDLSDEEDGEEEKQGKKENGGEEEGGGDEEGRRRMEEGGVRLDSESPARSAFAEEGVAVARRVWDAFWDPEKMHFRTTGRTAETVGSWNGYTFWAYLIGLEALLEAERTVPGSLRSEIHDALVGMEKFWSPDHGAYCAWLFFKGNGDIYIDDNAQAAILLLLAHRLLPKPSSPGLPYGSYLERASQVVDFCLKAWDTANGGGIRWHISTDGPPWTNRNACSTSLTAVAALELATLLREEGAQFEDARVRELAGWGRKCVDWVWETLVEDDDPDHRSYGLVQDGLVQHKTGGEWVIVGPTYTYNTGHTLTALVRLYDLLPATDTSYAIVTRTRARLLVTSSLDRHKSLYDTSVPDTQFRFWWDNNFFVHLLVEGLVIWGLRFGVSTAEPQLWERVKLELKRQLAYATTYLRDEEDGLYFRNWRLYTISTAHLEMYKALTGDVERMARYDGAERDADGYSLTKPVGERGMVKTLLGCAGASRALCIAGKVV